MTNLQSHDPAQISKNEASRIIDVIDKRIERNTRSMAMVETTWGTVAARDTGANTVDVYLYGSAYSSPGFRIIAGSPPAVAARVRVAIDKARGDRWVMEPFVGLDGTTTIGSGIGVQEDESTVVATATAVDFKHGLDVTASGTTARVAVDETELSIPEASLSTSDNTTANVTSTKHGFAPKSPADATKFLNGAATPAYANVKDSDLSTTDITTNNVSTSKHGFAPKLPNDATKFLDGTGGYSVPPGISGFINPMRIMGDMITGDGVISNKALASLGASVTITGHWGWANPSNIIDGNDTTYALQGNDANGTVITVTLDQSYTISKIRMLTPGGTYSYSGPYNISYSSNGTSWTLLTTYAGDGGRADDIYSITPTDAKYWRIDSPVGGYGEFEWLIYTLELHGTTAALAGSPVRLAPGTEGQQLTIVSGLPAWADDTVTLIDDTTNNVTSTKHGYAPKSPADATKFLNGATTPAYAQVKDSDLATTDITTNNVSTSKHGFAPKLPNDSTKYLDGTGAYTVPAGTGGGGGSALTVKDEGSNLDTAVTSIDFTGSGVTATNSGHAITVNVPSLTVEEIDGSPTDSAITKIVFPNDSVSISGHVATVRQIPTGTVGVSVHRTTSINPGGSYTSVGFDAEDYDTDGFHDNATNNSRLTVPAGLSGKYLISAAADSGPTNGFISLAKNGGVFCYQGMDQSVATISIVADLVAGDYIEVKASTSGATTFSAANAFSMIKLDSGKVGQGVGARAVWTTNQSVNDSTYAAINWTGTDDFDSDGFHDPSTNSNRFTVPAGLGGKYLVTANVGWESNATGYRGLVINKNLSASGSGDQVWANAANGIQTWQEITRVVDLVAGDYVSLSGYQTSGSAKNIVGGAMSIMRLDSPSSGPLGSSKVTLSSGDVTTTSTSFVDVTGLALTITTGPRRVLISFQGEAYATSSNDPVFTLLVDGTNVGDPTWGFTGSSGSFSSRQITFLTDVLPAGSHTFKVQWKVSGGTGHLYGGNNVGPTSTFAVQEMPDSGALAAGTGGALLGFTEYRPGTNTSYATTSTSIVDIDASNLLVTFTAPASGKVIVRLSGAAYESNTSNFLYYGLREGSTTVGGSQGVNDPQSGSFIGYANAGITVTGLVPGSVHTFKWAWRVSGGTGGLYGGPDFGSFIMEVWDASPSVPYVAGAGQLLATTAYDPTSDTNTLNAGTQTTQTDIDATNLSVTFIVPASGRVFIGLSSLAGATSSHRVYWGLREGTTNIKEAWALSEAFSQRAATRMLITGLTPGTTKTYKWSYRVDAGSAYLFSGPTYGQSVMEVWAA